MFLGGALLPTGGLVWGEVLGVLMFHGVFFRGGRFIPGNMDCTDTLTGLGFFGYGELGAMGE
jgi:hypothetical protein